MKRLLVLIVLLLLGTIAVGYYRGWFEVTVDQPEHKATITVDPDKIRADEEKALKRMRELRDNMKEQGTKPKPQEGRP